jgi:hypothetical protein
MLGMIFVPSLTAFHVKALGPILTPTFQNRDVDSIVVLLTVNRAPCANAESAYSICRRRHRITQTTLVSSGLSVACFFCSGCRTCLADPSEIDFPVFPGSKQNRGPDSAKAPHAGRSRNSRLFWGSWIDISAPLFNRSVLEVH